MSAVAGTTRAVRSGTRPRPRKSARPRRVPVQRRVASGVLSIGTVAVLLAGVVALNVAVLRLNVRLDELSAEKEKLRAEKAALASELSTAMASPRIYALARSRLGLLPAEPTYVRLK